MSIHKLGATSTVARAGVSFALAIAAVGGLATASHAAAAPAAPAASTQPAVTLSSSVGKETGGQALTATATSSKFYAGKDYVQFQSTTSLTGSCATTYATAVANSIINAASVATVLTGKKIVFTVPTLTGTTAGVTQTWLVCVYGGNTVGTSTLLGKAGYTSAGAPTLTALTAATAVTMPTYGGTTFSVSGTGFVTPLTATLDGVALTDINLIDSTLFTATIPPHAAGQVALSVTTVGGSATISGSATYGFTYIDAISVSPNTSPYNNTATNPVTLDVQGYGFNSKTFTTVDGTDADAAGSHVYLLKTVAGVPVYNATSFAAGADKTSAETSECISVSVISDTELTCALDLYKSRPAGNSSAANPLTSATAVPKAIYAISVVSTGSTATGTVTGQATTTTALVPYASSTFVVAPF